MSDTLVPTQADRPFVVRVHPEKCWVFQVWDTDHEASCNHFPVITVDSNGASDDHHERYAAICAEALNAALRTTPNLATAVEDGTRLANDLEMMATRGGVVGGCVQLPVMMCERILAALRTRPPTLPDDRDAVIAPEVGGLVERLRNAKPNTNFGSTICAADCHAAAAALGSRDAVIAEGCAWLRELAGNCKSTASNLYRDDDSDEAAEEWRVRGESYAFIADQIERGHSPFARTALSKHDRNEGGDK